MGFLSLKRDFQDMMRLRQIITILVEQGFHTHLAKARLAKHAKLSSRVIAEHRETTPQRVRETLELLGPTFVKLGQVLSIRPDLVPHEYCEEFKKLQDHVAPLPFAVVKGTIQAELGKPLEKLFRYFEHEPLAAASISQVHKATLNNGKHVIVKIQRPGIRETMAHDIDIMEYLAAKIDKHYPELRAQAIVGEFKEYTKRELDFSFELRNVKKFHAFFAETADVVIPEPFEEHSTTKVLVLEFIDGVRVSDKNALARAGFNLPKLGIIGFHALFSQVFDLGAFHADPHPGNLLAVKRGGHQALVFLDFGIVGFLDEQLREDILEATLALLDQDSTRLARVLSRVGEKTQGYDERKLRATLSGLIMDWHGSTMREEKMSLLIYKVFTEAIRGQLIIPASIVLFAKAFLTMEGTVIWLDPDFDFQGAAKPELQKLMQRRFGLRSAKKEFGRVLSEMRDIERQLPAAAEMLVEKIKEGKVELTIDKSEFKWVAHDYDLEASKHSLSLLSAAFFIGSSLIAGLAPELRFLEVPLYLWGFGCFFLMLIFLMHLTIKIHKYLKGVE